MSTELSVFEKLDRFRNATWRKKRRVDLATLNPWVPVHVAEEFSTNVHYASLQQSTCVPPRGVLQFTVEGRGAPHQRAQSFFNSQFF